MAKDINDIIHDKLIGSISAEDERTLREWIARNPRHQELYAQLLEDADFYEQYQRYHQIDTKRSWQTFKQKNHIGNRFLMHWRTVACAASFTLLLLGDVGYYQWTHRLVPPVISQEVTVAIKKSELAGKNQAVFIFPDGKRRVVSSDAEATALAQSLDEQTPCRIETQADKEFWVTLSDGTRIHLNSNTQLSYTREFASSERAVYLKGEAYFYVTKDKRRPFMVKTDNGTVKEYGTSFNVNTTEKPQTTQVVLVEGSISVITRNGDEHLVKPNQQAEIHQKNDVVTISPTDVKPYTSWNEGRFVFEDCPMARLLGVLAQWYDMKIHFKSDNSKNIHFTGALDKYGNITDILHAIESVTNVKITLHGDNIEIK